MYTKCLNFGFLKNYIDNFHRKLSTLYAVKDWWKDRWISIEIIRGKFGNLYRLRSFPFSSKFKKFNFLNQQVQKIQRIYCAKFFGFTNSQMFWSWIEASCMIMKILSSIARIERFENASFKFFVLNDDHQFWVRKFLLHEAKLKTCEASLQPPPIALKHYSISLNNIFIKLQNVDGYCKMFEHDVFQLII